MLEPVSPLLPVLVHSFPGLFAPSSVPLALRSLEERTKEMDIKEMGLEEHPPPKDTRKATEPPTKRRKHARTGVASSSPEFAEASSSSSSVFSANSSSSSEFPVSLGPLELGSVLLGTACDYVRVYVC